MTDKQTEHQVNESFNRTKPNVYDSVSADCPARTAKVNTRKAGIWGWKFATCALSIVLVIAVVFGGIGFGKLDGTRKQLNKLQASLQAGMDSDKAVSAITLDVNPSVSVRINESRRVVEVEALNKDGKLIVGDMDLRGVQLNVAVNALIGSMLRLGYLRTDANSVLVSVDAAQSDYDALVELVTEEITLKLKEGNIAASVLSQWIREGDDAKQLADRLNISVGKAQLINGILSNTPEGVYTAEQLAALTVNELNIILEQLNIPRDELTHSGSASQSGYIGRDAAIAAALVAVNADLTEQDVGEIRCKIDNEDGVMVYEIEFVYGDKEYDIDVHAITGDIVKLDYEHVRPTTPAEKILDESEIITLFFDTIKVPEEIRGDYHPQVSYHREDGDYEVKMLYDGIMYEIEFDRYGEVKDYSQKPVQVPPELPPDEQWSGNAPSEGYSDIMSKVFNYIAKRENLTILEEDTFEWEIEKDNEHGQAVYEVEFKWRDPVTGRVFEFDCEVDVRTSEVLRYNKEIDD